MNRCDQARRLFGAYWDDEVTQAEREWLESHLGGCPACRQQYEQFTHTLEAVGSLPRIDTSADLPERALVAARRAAAVPDRIAIAPARPVWIQVTATAAHVRPESALVDSVLNHSEDVEFILDPVVLHRGRAQAPSRLPKGVQGEQAVISF